MLLSNSDKINCELILGEVEITEIGYLAKFVESMIDLVSASSDRRRSFKFKL
jgi:hypothetical protein